MEFHKQVPLHQFIVDFYGHELQLAIEIDSNSHDNKYDYDCKQQNILENLGLHFIRFTDIEVKKELFSILLALDDKIVVMNKKEKTIIYNRLQKLLNPYFEEKGFKFNNTLFKYTKNGLTISWGGISNFETWLTFKPYFIIQNDQINLTYKNIFPNIGFYKTSLRVQSTRFAHEFGVYDFDDSPFNHSSGKISTYGYRICLEEEDAGMLEGTPIIYDVAPIIKDHIAFLEKVAFVYFEKLSTVKGINEYFNNRILSLSEAELQSETVQDSLQKEEVLSAIIAAYLEKDSRYTNIVAQYKKLYAKNNWYLKDINLLADWINENTIG